MSRSVSRGLFAIPPLCALGAPLGRDVEDAALLDSDDDVAGKLAREDTSQVVTGIRGENAIASWHA